jgi:hypothetical protein
VSEEGGCDAEEISEHLDEERGRERGKISYIDRQTD